jgi:hypothetical protein
MRPGVTCTRNAYHFPVSNVKYDRVSLSEASHPSMLERPTISPPHPPVTNVQKESSTGKVRVAKKSLPFIRAASKVTS